MRPLFIILATLLISLNIAGQTPKSKPSPGVYNFNKKKATDNISYLFTAKIDIKNGKEEKVKVNFRATISIAAWKDYVKRYTDNNEKDLFYLITALLSMKAQYTLNNTLSFEPIKNQFFFYDEEKKVFICKYKMMGRNGYGNMVETSEFVEYDVEPELK